MKKQLFRCNVFLIALLAFFSACSTEGIELYRGVRYVQFSTPFTDSVTASFLISEDTISMMVPLELELVGFPAETDTRFRIRLISEHSTAMEGDVELPEYGTFRAHRAVDTAWIRVFNRPELAQTAVKVVLQLVETEDLKVGDPAHSQKTLYVSNQIYRPAWWNNTVQSQYLGAYSNKKFRLFAQVNGIIELDPNNLTLLRLYTVQFKNYLIREKDQGRTVYEENGTEMTVALTGG